MFPKLIIVMFILASGEAFYRKNYIQFQIYLASAWLNFVFLGVK